jgi:hypothetical protein
MTGLTLRCVSWRPFKRNTPVGFATIAVDELHITLRDVAIQRHEAGARWAQLPSRPVLDLAGTPLRDPVTGKITYATMFDFDSAASRTAFSREVVQAVARFAPDAFNMEGAA